MLDHRKAMEPVVFSEFPAFLIPLMGVPKRKTSKMRLRTRKASHRWQPPQLNKCTQCGSTVASHTACPSCGYYKGRQVLTVEAK
jgi:large subunit ribosomal protein L32